MGNRICGLGSSQIVALCSASALFYFNRHLLAGWKMVGAWSLIIKKKKKKVKSWNSRVIKRMRFTRNELIIIAIYIYILLWMTSEQNNSPLKRSRNWMLIVSRLIKSRVLIIFCTILRHIYSSTRDSPRKFGVGQKIARGCCKFSSLPVEKF